MCQGDEQYSRWHDSHMKVTEKGQVTPPKELRDALRIGAVTEVDYERTDDAILVRQSADKPTRVRKLAERLRGRGDRPTNS